ncbi:MAG: hypothetical protein J6X49_11650 [Victivallales bacterium]|nr:hypothetical protein [Victivallales bacterium]
MVESEKRGGEGQTAPKILFSTSEKRFFIYITLWKQVICDLCPAGGMAWDEESKFSEKSPAFWPETLLWKEFYDFT